MRKQSIQVIAHRALDVQENDGSARIETVSKAKKVLLRAQLIHKTNENDQTEIEEPLLTEKTVNSLLQARNARVSPLPGREDFSNKDYYLTWIKNSHALYKYKEQVIDESASVSWLSEDLV